MHVTLAMTAMAGRIDISNSRELELQQIIVTEDGRAERHIQRAKEQRLASMTGY